MHKHQYNHQKRIYIQHPHASWPRVIISAILLVVGLCAPLAFPATVWGQALGTYQHSVVRRSDPQRSLIQIGEQIDGLLTQMMNNQQFSGSVLVAQNGQILVDKGYSLANRDSGIYNQPDTRFYLGSLTKAFTAMALLMLQEQGKLHVQDKLCNYILSAASPAAWIASFNNAPLQFTPGGEFQYCSICYQILGYVVQQVSGVPYTQYIQQMILQPLQMGETGFDVNAYYALSVGALGYESWGVKATPVGFQTDPQWSFLFGSGLLYSSVNDLYRWDQALYTTRLVSQATLNQIFTPYANASPLFSGSAYGYGWFITQAPIQGHRLLWHDGVIDGYRNYIGRAVDDGVTVIILSNLTTLDAISLGHQIEGIIL